MTKGGSWFTFDFPKTMDTLHKSNISHLGKRTSSSKVPFKGDILVPRRVILTISKVISSHPNPRFHTWHATRFPFLFFILAWENFERTTQVVIGTGPVFPKNIWMGPGVVRMRWCVARTPRWDVHNFGKNHWCSKRWFGHTKWSSRQNVCQEAFVYPIFFSKTCVPYNNPKYKVRSFTCWIRYAVLYSHHFSNKYHKIPPLKQTAPPEKIGAWETFSFSFGANWLLVSGRVVVSPMARILWRLSVLTKTLQALDVEHPVKTSRPKIWKHSFFLRISTPFATY